MICTNIDHGLSSGTGLDRLITVSSHPGTRFVDKLQMMLMSLNARRDEEMMMHYNCKVEIQGVCDRGVALVLPGKERERERERAGMC